MAIIGAAATGCSQTCGLNYAAERGGYIDGIAEQTVDVGGDGSGVEAVPYYGFVFVEWSDGVKAARREDKAVQSDINVTAIFHKKAIDVTYVAYGNGTISGNASQSVEWGGDAEEVTAVPDNGYVFIEWSDGVKDATRKDTEVIGDKVVKAVFVKKSYNVRYLSDGNGAVRDNKSLHKDYIQSVKYLDSAASVTAVPDEGYEFVEWSDGSKEITRTDKNVQNDMAIIAYFAIKEFTLEYDRGLDPSEGRVINGAKQRVEYGQNGHEVSAIPNEGYDFVEWSDGVKTQDRRDENIKQNIEVKPVFAHKPVTVKYIETDGGMIPANRLQKVEYGKDAVPVKAIPHDGYVFLYWSDGVETAERTDKNVTCDMTITAYFGYGAEYIVNNGVGGKLRGEVSQKVSRGADCTDVEAIPDEGYVFCGWSDLQLSTVRKDTNVKRRLEYIAYFEPIRKTFTYDYGIADGIPMESEVTFERNNLRIDGYPIPKLDGYTFKGWYADKDYKVKAINEFGRYMLGYYGFTLDTTTLYARWEPENETKHVFKMLFVFFDEVKAKLEPVINLGDGPQRDVYRKMTSMDMKYCELLHQLTTAYLTEWLQPFTEIEIDVYYTTVTLTEEYIHRSYRNYDIDPSLPEIVSFNTSYHNVMYIWGFDDDGTLLGENYSGCYNSRKYADVYLPAFYWEFSSSMRQDALELYRTNEISGLRFARLVIDRFIDICEISVFSIYGERAIHFFDAYHQNIRSLSPKEIIRRYLAYELTYNGEVGGIPHDFWSGRCDALLNR